MTEAVCEAGVGGRAAWHKTGLLLVISTTGTSILPHGFVSLPTPHACHRESATLFNDFEKHCAIEPSLISSEGLGPVKTRLVSCEHRLRLNE